MLRQTLFALTGDPREVDPVVALLDARDTKARPQAAELLARFALPPTLVDPIARWLYRWWLDATALPLVAAWLSAQGLPTHQIDGVQANFSFRRTLSAWLWHRAGVLADMAGELSARS